MSITTKAGDRGTTRLYSGEEVAKHDARVEGVGDVDELVSALGLARAHRLREQTAATVVELQRRLFVVGAEIATTGRTGDGLPARIDAEAVRRMDALCAETEARTAVPGGFVVPGGTSGAAHLDHARAVARRCERRIARLYSDGRLANPHLLVWMNRLSDLLWLLARGEEGRPTLVKEG
jgi:cob(I)alamin adenosyltransferase